MVDSVQMQSYYLNNPQNLPLNNENLLISPVFTTNFYKGSLVA